MTDYNKVFLDTAPFIYFIEKDSNNPQYFDNMKQFLEEGYRENKEFLTSVITMAEYFVFPYSNQKMSYIDSFHRLVDTLDMEIAEVDQEIAKKAAQIRAQYKNFKAMDALQLATACVTGCNLFLTNDKQLKQFTEIKCVTVDDL